MIGRHRLGLLALVVTLAVPSVAVAEPVLLISIDGLRPGDVFEAEKRGLKIPNLRRFVREGATASGVVGVLPTVTYPSHATLLTGASPARHWITGNTTFDPTNINQSGWFWYATDIKVPTLWDAARAKGLTVGNVHWPVSVGAASITWNLPQIWRTGHPDDEKLVRALATPGLLAPMEARLGFTYARGIDEDIEADENRGRFAEDLLRDKKPDFATVYLTAYDHYQHRYGPGAREAHAVIERIDAIVGRLMAAARPGTVTALVSDHGFEATTTEVNFFRAFIDAGLIALDKEGKIARWDAVPANSGGSVAVVVARPDDAALIAKVWAMLGQLKAAPDSFIATVVERSDIERMGANPQAQFYVDLKPGFLSGGFEGPAVPLRRPAKYKGMHGYFPAAPAMRSTFMITGPGVQAGRALGEIDMRAIAPTLAAILKVELPQQEMKPLRLR